MVLRRAGLVVGVVAFLGCSGFPDPPGTVNATVDALSALSVTRVSVSAAPAGVSQDLAFDGTTGKFSGALVLPPGDQTILAQAYAGTTLVGSATATVTVRSGATASVQLTILDATRPPPNPDRGPIITQFAVPQTTVAAGEVMTVSATAVDLDGQAVSYAWTSAPSGCGTFAEPSAATTSWTAVAVGTCSVQVAAFAGGKTDTRSVDVAIAAAGGTLSVQGTFVARPVIVAFDLQGAAGACRILRADPDATCRAGFVAGATHAVSFEWAKHPMSASAETSLTDTCGGTATLLSVDTSGENDVARWSWTAPAAAGACGLTASAKILTLADTFSVGLLVSGSQAALSKVAGDRQTAGLGAAVATRPAVRVTDGSGNPVAGVAVRFAAVTGGGGVSEADAVTAADGTASTAWTLGSVGVNQLTATAGGGSVTFTATATPGLCAPSDVVAAISPDQLVATATALTGIERTSYAGQGRAVEWLEGRLLELGVAFSSVSYVLYGSTWTDLEIVFPGRSLGTQLYAAGAHYDAAKGYPGADDDASGTAAVVELARVLSGCQLERTVRLLLFFNEEGGAVGSREYAAAIRARGDDLRGFVSLDMIGWRPPDGDLEVVTRPAWEPLANAVVAAGNRWVGSPPATAVIDESCG